MAMSLKSVEMDNLEQHFTRIFLVINIPFCQVFSRYTLSTNVLNLFFVGRKKSLKTYFQYFLSFYQGELRCFRKMSTTEILQIKLS